MTYELVIFIFKLLTPYHRKFQVVNIYTYIYRYYIYIYIHTHTYDNYEQHLLLAIDEYL